MLSTMLINIGRECGYNVASSDMLGATDTNTRQLVAMANRVIQEMLEEHNWPKLRKSGSITLVADQATYALPGDFSYYHYETFWNSSDQWKLYGPLTSQEYAERIGYGDLASVYDEFTIRGMTDQEITIHPTPDSGVAGNVITFQYTSARPVRPRTWEASLAVTSGAYIFYNGNYYTADSGGTTGSTAPTHTTGSATDGGINWTYYDDSYLEFLADTDVPTLSERVLSQGVLERFAELHQLNIVPRFREQLDLEYAKTVQGKIVSATSLGRRGRFTHALNGRVNFGS